LQLLANSASSGEPFKCKKLCGYKMQPHCPKLRCQTANW